MRIASVNYFQNVLFGKKINKKGPAGPVQNQKTEQESIQREKGYITSPYYSSYFWAASDDNEKKLKESKRKTKDGKLTSFTDSEIKDIANKITPTNSRYLDTILTLNQSRLSSNHIIQMLEYINSIDKKEADGKIQALKVLPQILEKEFGQDLYSDSESKKLFTSIDNDTYTILMQSDLLADGGISGDFKIAAEKIKKYVQPKQNEETNEAAKRRLKRILPYMGEALLTGSIVPSSTFEDLMHNKTVNFETMAKKINLLNRKDIRFIKNVSRNAVTTDNRNEEIYPVSDLDIIKVINLAAYNRRLKSEGYKGINIKNKRYTHETAYLAPHFTLDIKQMERDLLPDTLISNGVPQDIVNNYMKKFDIVLDYSKKHNTRPSRKVFWDTNFVYLMGDFSKDKKPMRDMIKEMTKQVARYREHKYDTKEMFLKYITSPETVYGRRNKKTEYIFKNNKLDYNAWINGDFPETSADFTSKLTPDKPNSKTLTARVWNRIPQESLFDGNYTSSPTGIGEKYGFSHPEYMTSTFMNVIEVRNERDELVGTSDIYMAKINDTPSLVIDNINVRDITKNRYLYNKEAAKKYRELIFDCAEGIANRINLNGKKKIPVYFTNANPNVENILDNLKPVGARVVQILGSAPDEFYLNAYADTYGTTIRNKGENHVFILPNLIDVSGQNTLSEKKENKK